MLKYISEHKELAVIVVAFLLINRVKIIIVIS